MRAALPKILIATFGSLGDLYPFVALGQALQREGFAVVVATSETYRDLIIEEGLCFAAIRPDVEEATERLGMDLGEIARRMSAFHRLRRSCGSGKARAAAVRGHAFAVDALLGL